MFDHLFVSHLAADPLLWREHNPWLVALSLLVSVGAAAVALHMAQLAASATAARTRQMALGSGALALGSGIWTMHYIGMLAFSVCGQSGFNPWMTLASVILALGASWVALQLLARPQVGAARLLGSGLLVGGGIGAMHYLGMAASDLAPQMRYDLRGFVLSIVVAVALAVLALWIRYGLRSLLRLGATANTLLAGAVMGLAIAGMHYTGMAALRFDTALDALPRTGGTVPVQTTVSLAIAVVTVALTLLLLAVNASLRARRLLDQVQRSESLQRAMRDTAVDAIITIDGKGVVQSANPATERLFGRPAARIVGRSITRLIPGPGHLQHDAELYHLLTTGQSPALGQGRQTSGLHKSGAVVPLRMAISGVDRPGAPLFMCFITDLSHYKALEAERERGEQMLRSLVSNLPGIAFRCGTEPPWPMAFISDTARQITGWNAADFLEGRVNFGELIHTEDASQIEPEIDYALKHGLPYHVEYRITTRDGRTRWMSEYGRGAPAEDGRVRWLDGVILDITQSKERNAEFAGTLAALDRSQAMAEFNLQGHLVHANANFLAMMGYTLDDVIGRHHSFFCQPQTAASAAYRAFWKALADGQVQSDEYLRLGRDGREIWLLATYNPIFGADGKVIKIVELASDLSQRRAMEQQLRHAKDDAEKAAAARASFLANMSHEIRTPMNAIIGFSEALADSPLEAAQRRQITLVQRAGQTLLRLLNDILDTAKLDRGAMELEERDFSLRELCQQVLDSMQVGATQKKLALVLDYPESVPSFMRGDALRVQQILVNLVSNAIKFTERGQVQLRVAYADGQLLLQVRDTGIGMDAAQLARIFEPFTQADASTTRRFGGTGLGTTIARQLAELMRGRIEAQSTPGQGSTFSVHLPLPVGSAPAPGVQPAAAMLAPLRILAVDDMEHNLELLQVTLSRAGHRLVLARGGEAAVQQSQAQAFDLVLMDLQMPDVDGCEATRRIRADEQASGRASVPIIALSASVLAEDQRRALAAGMNGFANKPLDLAQLNTEIARVLGLPGGATSASDPAAAPPAAPPPPQARSAPAIDWARGTALWGSQGRLHDTIARWTGENVTLISRLRTLHAQGQSEPLAALAHKSAGVAGNMALPTLHALLQRIDLGAREGDSPAVATALQALPAAWSAVALALQVHARKTAGAPVASAVRRRLDGPRRARALQAMAHARQTLAQGELPDTAMGQLDTLLPPETLAPLRATLEEFAFDRALQQLDALQAQIDLSAP